MVERLWLEIELENLDGFREGLKLWHPILKESIFRSWQKLASKLEREFKATTGFKDRTGRLRRSIFATATFEPLGIEYGALAPYAIYVERGHGTWKGGWLAREFKARVSQINEYLKKGLEEAIRKYRAYFAAGGKP